MEKIKNTKHHKFSQLSIFNDNNSKLNDDNDIYGWITETFENCDTLKKNNFFQKPRTATGIANRNSSQFISERKLMSGRILKA